MRLSKGGGNWDYWLTRKAAYELFATDRGIPLDTYPFKLKTSAYHGSSKRAVAVDWGSLYSPTGGRVNAYFITYRTETGGRFDITVFPMSPSPTDESDTLRHLKAREE